MKLMKMKISSVTFATTVCLVLCASVTTAPAGDSDQLQTQLATATSGFSQHLYEKVAAGKNKNVVYSPYSIHSALTMTSTGARGKTLDEMRTVLETTSLGDDVNAAYRNVIGKLNSADGVTLNTANALFLKPGMVIERQFQNDVVSSFSAVVKNFDMNFQGGPEKEVNNYVAKKTNDVIQDLLMPGTISQSTLVVLINTIFFNGTWEQSFPKGATKEKDFHRPDGSLKKVDMMRIDAHFRYKRDAIRQADVIEIPFRNPRFSLTIVLPHDNDGIKNLENTLATNGGVIDDIFQGLKYKYIRTSIPKFKVETSLNLSDILKSMGMKLAFGAADFSGINKEVGLFIDAVIHKAVIEVKETGTVAAAATAVVMSRSGMVFTPRTAFNADHAFLYFLRDSQTGQVLFQGKFTGF